MGNTEQRERMAEARQEVAQLLESGYALNRRSIEDILARFKVSKTGLRGEMIAGGFSIDTGVVLKWREIAVGNSGRVTRVFYAGKYDPDDTDLDQVLSETQAQFKTSALLPQTFQTEFTETSL